MLTFDRQNHREGSVYVMLQLNASAIMTTIGASKRTKKKTDSIRQQWQREDVFPHLLLI
jgi:hypothetical protein